MDGVSASASILGIIGFSVQALKAINWLRDFSEEYATDRKAELLDDLTKVATTIASVKELCEQVQQANLSLHLDLRTNALSIQVEDCTHDLEKWLKIAERLKSEDQFKEKSAVRKWLKTSRRVWAMFINSSSRSSRVNLYERLRWHQGNIEISLAVFGRRFDVLNATRLEEVERVTKTVHTKICDEAEGVVSRLDALSTSSSSLLAHSRSTAERLKDVGTETSGLTAEIRDIKEMLLEALSHHSSHSSAQHDSLSSSGRGYDQRIPTRRIPLHNKQSAVEFNIRRRRESGEDVVTINDSEYGETEPEFKTLLKATYTLIDVLQTIHHPTLAEYISTFNAMKLLSVYESSIRLPTVIGLIGPKSRIARHTAKRAEQQLQEAKAQLLKLRKICHREGLADSLEAIDNQLGIDSLAVAEWTEIIDQAPPDSFAIRQWSGVIQASNPTGCEASTRMAEWMFHVTQSISPCVELHQRILRKVCQRTYGEIIVPTITDEPGIFRQMLKFWFIDSEDVEIRNTAASLVAATVLTDTTATPLDSESDWPSTLTASVMDDNLNNMPIVLRSLEHPFLSETSCRVLYDSRIRGPSEVPARKVHAAEGALEAYYKDKSPELNDLASIDLVAKEWKTVLGRRIVDQNSPSDLAKLSHNILDEALGFHRDGSLELMGQSVPLSG